MIEDIRAFSDDENLIRERRDHIARNSAKVFVKNGFERTTVQELADACSLSVGSLYRYFGSKNDILHYFVERGLDLLKQSVEGYLWDSESMDPTEALTHFIDMYYHLMDDEWNLCLFTYQETKNLDATVRKKLMDDATRDVAACEQLLKRGIETGEFTIENPVLVAHNVIIIGHMWAVRRWFLKRRFTLEEYIRVQTEAVLRMVAATETVVSTKSI